MTSRMVLVGTLVACFQSQPTCASEDLSQDWFDLWSRCRIAIETGTAVDANGLDNLGLRTRIKAPFKVGEYIVLPGYEYEEQSWGRPGSEFVIREREYPRGNGKVARICEVSFLKDEHGLTDANLSVIVNTFTEERGRLIEMGGYEIRNPDPIFPVAVGVGPTSKNQNNCQVISYLQSTPDLNNKDASRFFVSGTGEQTIHNGCAGPSLLTPKGYDPTVE
ncbi:hypothetical protein [Notoacmeibacter marinus]|nr:hypothetical protein [Notoacmeibacter marinus]